MEHKIAPPDPSSLIEAFRALGYSLSTAIADLIDNSITAQARSIQINFHWAGRDSHICILDDGRGMSQSELFEAMRPGSRSPLDIRDSHDLGRFGLGLKTASFSQCRELCVLSKSERDPLSVYTWNLDYVSEHKEWRLLVGPSLAAESWQNELSRRLSGTAVVWSALDRLVGNTSAQDPAAQSRFHGAIEHVRQHLALTFHRFLEAHTLTISMNDNEITPWNPFMEKHDTTYKTGEERIPIGRSAVLFKGFVLPHKDRLTMEEYATNAGPRGWTGQQGFYVYRNKRLLLQGDWLRLGNQNPWTREEQYKLARIRLDIDNDTDIEWQLDVKKSTARPPAIIRDRLTDLAANIRAEARKVFVHRGQYGARAGAAVSLERPWVSRLRNGHRVYLIDRVHPMVSAVIEQCGQASPAVDSMLRLLEESVPIQQIWLDTAEQVQDQAIPYEGVDFAILRADMRQLFQILLKSGINRETALQRIHSMEPFNRYPKLIREL
ncbi:MAG TPA: ATP-binding protein [Nitrospiraceae bacterium]|jgi:hypothetical protein|nr:ATP-binding protein [Nitrospiraceae bacterium]